LVRDERGNRAVSDLWGETGEPDRPAAGLFSRLRPPEVTGYEILGELGRGGMGVVYKARQLRLNRVVALKMILAGDYAGPDAVERIMAKAEIVTRLQHPNIVQIYAIGDCEGRP
jgi:serine/threonine protein kinase